MRREMGNMEVEEIEAVLEKIWDLHDKLSDAIHSISRAHFLNSVKSLRNKKTTKPSFAVNGGGGGEENRGGGFVFVKDFRMEEDTVDAAAIQEAKSLNAIRTALENLEDQLDFFHTVQAQQQAERDAAIARLEQSRIVLAMRLAEHRGMKYKVIEEALAFVGDVQDASRFISPANLYCSPVSPSDEKLIRNESKNSNVVMKVLISSFDFAKRSLKLDHVGGILSNAAVFAFSMVALVHLHHIAYKAHPDSRRDPLCSNRNMRNSSGLEGSSTTGGLNQLDVMLARG